MLNVLIMAGGKGTRFWPASTTKRPKQFLKLINENTMLQNTINRILPLIDYEHIFICTSREYVHFVKEQVPQLKSENIIIEPVGRNTAPCILLGTIYINELYNNSNILVLPSDHMILNEKEFLSIIKDANEFLLYNNNTIITLGVEPNRPETGYGYIKYQKEFSHEKNHKIYKVEKFVEKPNYSMAKEYIKDGSYLWNAGMFMFNSSYMLYEFQQNYSSFNLFKNLPSIFSDEYINRLEEIYIQSEAISIDYAVMEKTKNIYVIFADFGWDDIGSWKALERYIKKDENQNIIKGNIKSINSQNNIIYSTNKQIILLDVENLFFIDADNTIIIGNKNSLDKVYTLKENTE